MKFKKQPKTFVIGDIHGRYEALKEVLTKSHFNYEKDLLIILGDVVDGGYDAYEVVEELIKIKNSVFIFGNHDKWFIQHVKTGWAEDVWLNQGGRNTLESYTKRKGLLGEQDGKLIPCTHQLFFDKALKFFILNNVAFIHGGFEEKKGLERTDEETLLWDRSLINLARFRPIKGFEKIFVGHTTTQIYGNDLDIKDVLRPLKFNNLIMMDTGAGWDGVLSIMDVGTEEFWTSSVQTPAVRRQND